MAIQEFTLISFTFYAASAFTLIHFVPINLHINIKGPKILICRAFNFVVPLFELKQNSILTIHITSYNGNIVLKVRVSTDIYLRVSRYYSQFLQTFRSVKPPLVFTLCMVLQIYDSGNHDNISYELNC
jgi:hypothetical protein